jgi:hypothetical protein
LSEPLPIGAAPATTRDPRAAIARAAQATGVDFSYLLAQARIESSLDPSARAPTSSAAGLYQFTRGTWEATLGRHGGEHGLGWAQDAVTSGAMRDPAMRERVMALRFDPEASARMAAELAGDNRADLSARLGREPDASELYLAHFLGSAGASKFLEALAANPGQSAAALMPAAAAANRGIFYSGGAPRSVSGVMDLIRAKVTNAMDGAGALPQGDFQEAWPPASWQSASASFSGSPPAPAAPAPAQRPSMAETLRATFALSEPGNVPGHVRAAYGQLRSLGL